MAFDFRWTGPGRTADEVYAELVDSIFRRTLPFVFFGIAQAVIGIIICVETGDTVVVGLAILALLASGDRIMLVRRYCRDTPHTRPSVAEAHRWERRFVVRSAFAGAIVSATTAYCYTLPNEGIHTLVTAMLFAYGGGMVARVAYRPQITLINLLVLSVPPAAAAFARGGPTYICLGFTILIFLLGAYETTQYLYRVIVSQLTLKRQFAGLARRDPLTGLSNRLALAESLLMLMMSARKEGSGLAVHSLDLDRFKSANDMFGHSAGDAILKEVAQRLSRLTRAGDLLVRLGGDEFLLIQTGVASREQAAALAARIIADVGRPYRIEGNDVEIGTSVGIALLTDDTVFAEELLSQADQALYQAKRSQAGYAFHVLSPQLVPPLPDQQVASLRSAARG